MSTPAERPDTARFEEGRLPIEVIVVWDADGGWHAAAVYHRTGDSPVMIHPQWSEPLSWVIKPWEYFSERLRDGQGGNGYNYDVWGFEVATEEDIAPVVTAREAEVVVATHGPMGESAGTLLSDQPDGTARIIPFLVLADEVGDAYLVATEFLSSGPPAEVRTEAGQPVDPVPFRIGGALATQRSPRLAAHPPRALSRGVGRRHAPGRGRRLRRLRRRPSP
jgi:hypothetical protein